MSRNQLIAAITDTLKDKMDIVTEASDSLLSAAADSGALKDVPLFSVAYKVYELNNRLQENRLRRNCIAFLEACKDTDPAKRQAAMDDIAQDEKRLEDFSDSLLQILCESFKPVKAGITGSLLRALIDKNFDYAQFDRLLHIVHAASIPSLKALRAFCKANGTSLDGNWAEEPLILSLGVGFRYGTRFHLSNDGCQLFEYALKDTDFNLKA